MINKEEAKMIATIEIADFFGLEYVREHLSEATQSFPTDDWDDIDYEYFLGFEGDTETNKWTVFARVTVNRETKVVTFLDYKTPDGKRMDNSIKPISFAQAK